MPEICIQTSYDQNVQLILKSYISVVYGTPLSRQNKYVMMMMMMMMATTTTAVVLMMTMMISYVVVLFHNAQLYFYDVTCSSQ
jgi:hypothetical protein